MDNRVKIGVAAIVALVAGGFWWTRGAGKRQLAQCSVLKAQRAQLAVSGANSDDLARLDIAIATCESAARALGETVDGAVTILGGCDVKRDAMEREFAAYRATAKEDAIQRNNKRQNILHLAAEMISCYRDAIERSESVEAIDAVRASIKKAAEQSQERARCYYFDWSGCGTYGANEDTGPNKGHDERRNIMETLVGPLADGVSAGTGVGGIMADAIAKRDMLRSTARATERQNMEAQ